jgi:pimeloyl-ACP methyl ester carboxylesterase
MVVQSDNLPVNGHRLYVEQAGVGIGPAVALLHHGLGSVKAWRGQIPLLAQAGFRLIAYDRWGYGASDARPALDLPGFASDINDLYSILTQLGIPRVALVGHSDGGTIALYFAAQYPHLVSCLVTVAAHIYVEPKMEPAILGIERQFLADEHFRRGMQSAHGGKYESVFRNWYDGWHREEHRGWDMRVELEHIQCPCLIVQGEDDEHASPQHARDIAESIQGAELWLVPGARHMLPQEAAAPFNQKLVQFLNLYGHG